MNIYWEPNFPISMAFFSSLCAYTWMIHLFIYYNVMWDELPSVEQCCTCSWEPFHLSFLAHIHLFQDYGWRCKVQATCRWVSPLFALSVDCFPPVPPSQVAAPTGKWRILWRYTKGYIIIVKSLRGVWKYLRYMSLVIILLLVVWEACGSVFGCSKTKQDWLQLLVPVILTFVD